jgi:hypothetical protein
LEPKLGAHRVNTSARLLAGGLLLHWRHCKLLLSRTLSRAPWAPRHVRHAKWRHLHRAKLLLWRKAPCALLHCFSDIMLGLLPGLLFD